MKEHYTDALLCKYMGFYFYKYFCFSSVLSVKTVNMKL